MTKLNGNLKWVVGSIGLLVSLGTIIFAAGGLRSDIDRNTKDILHNQEYGCDPYNKVMAPKVVGFEHEISALAKDMKEIKDTLNKILAIQMNQPQF